MDCCGGEAVASVDAWSAADWVVALTLQGDQRSSSGQVFFEQVWLNLPLRLQGSVLGQVDNHQ